MIYIRVNQLISGETISKWIDIKRCSLGPLSWGIVKNIVDIKFAVHMQAAMALG